MRLESLHESKFGFVQSLRVQARRHLREGESANMWRLHMAVTHRRHLRVERVLRCGGYIWRLHMAVTCHRHLREERECVEGERERESDGVTACGDWSETGRQNANQSVCIIIIIITTTTTTTTITIT